MGVLQRIVTTVPRARTSSNSTSASNADSDSESSLQSDQLRTTNTHNQQQGAHRNQLQDDITSSGRGKYGKRKQRRLTNRDFLLLHKIDEDEELNVMEFRKSGFQRLYETMSTVASLATIDALDDYQERGILTVTVSAPTSKDRHPYLRISRRIRHSIRHSIRKRSKARLVVQVVLATEEKILSQSTCSDTEWTLKLLWDSCIHRFLLHAVAQYHGFRSATILVDDDGTEHLVRVIGDPHVPNKEIQPSLLNDLMRFAYTDALADALQEHDLCLNEKV